MNLNSWVALISCLACMVATIVFAFLGKLFPDVKIFSLLQLLSALISLSSLAAFAVTIVAEMNSFEKEMKRAFREKDKGAISRIRRYLGDPD